MRGQRAADKESRVPSVRVWEQWGARGTQGSPSCGRVRSRGGGSPGEGGNPRVRGRRLGGARGRRIRGGGGRLRRGPRPGGQRPRGDPGELGVSQGSAAGGSRSRAASGSCTALGLGLGLGPAPGPSSAPARPQLGPGPAPSAPGPPGRRRSPPVARQRKRRGGAFPDSLWRSAPAPPRGCRAR